jgi:addiction module RelE/StbE family toxin
MRRNMKIFKIFLLKNMQIDFSKNFLKKFKQLPIYTKDSIVSTIEFFQESPHHPSLRNHALSGQMAGKRSISVDADMRIIFIEKDDYIEVLMLEVGTHDEVYE